MTNYHANSCHFLMKLCHSLSYIGIDLESGFKKTQQYQRRKRYNKNSSHVRSLIDTAFIPFSGADKNTLIDVVDGDSDVFSPCIINSVENED